MPPLVPAQIEQKLEDVIARYKGKGITVREIRQKIYESDGDVMEASNRFMKWWWQRFPSKALEREGVEEVLQAFNDAWNVFPHRSLNGKSPQEMIQEFAEESGPRKNTADAMPKMIVDGREMAWDDYWAMIKEMEKRQEPFKAWMEKTLPAYRTYLTKKYKTVRSIEKHDSVASVFLERALQVGFLDFNEIRPEFAVWEFPAWWQTHVMQSSLTEDQVWSSLCDFLWFCENILHRTIPGVWEEAG